MPWSSWCAQQQPACHAQGLRKMLACGLTACTQHAPLRQLSAKSLHASQRHTWRCGSWPPASGGASASSAAAAMSAISSSAQPANQTAMCNKVVATWKCSHRRPACSPNSASASGLLVNRTIAAAVVFGTPAASPSGRSSPAPSCAACSSVAAPSACSVESPFVCGYSSILQPFHALCALLWLSSTLCAQVSRISMGL